MDESSSQASLEKAHELMESGETQEAFDMFVAFSENPPSLHMQAQAIHMAGVTARLLGNFSEAKAYLEDAEERAKELKDRWMLARVLRDLGATNQDIGHYEDNEKSFRDAEYDYEESIEVFCELHAEDARQADAEIAATRGFNGLLQHYLDQPRTANREIFEGYAALKRLAPDFETYRRNHLVRAFRVLPFFQKFAFIKDALELTKHSWYQRKRMLVAFAGDRVYDIATSRTRGN